MCVCVSVCACLPKIIFKYRGENMEEGGMLTHVVIRCLAFLSSISIEMAENVLKFQFCLKKASHI